LSLLINSLPRISNPDIMILCQDKQELISQEIFRENGGLMYCYLFTWHSFSYRFKDLDNDGISNIDDLDIDGDSVHNLIDPDANNNGRIICNLVGR